MNTDKFVLVDGATGSQLQKHGFDNECGTEQWVLKHPEVLLSIQRAYVEAGSDVIYAPTFGANRIKMEANGVTESVKEFNAALVGLSRQAAGGKALVAGDISPLGKFLEPMGDMSFDEMVEIYEEQAEALEEAGVDLFVLETMMTVPEARAAVLAVKKASDRPVFVTFTCDAAGRILGGTDVTAALLIMQGMGVDAFGLNCSVGPEEMLTQIRRMQRVATIPLIAKPNAGMPQVEDGKVVYHCPPEAFTAVTGEFVKAGVRIFGGCCGTDETHIAALKKILDELSAAGSQNTGSEEVIFAASEQELFSLAKDRKPGNPVPCGEDLAEAAEDAADEEDGILTIRLEDASELENLAENQYAFTTPVCFVCDDADLLEQALKLYQGRALYHGTIGAKERNDLVRRFGMTEI